MSETSGSGQISLSQDELFGEWLEGRLTSIGQYSTSTASDYRALINRAHQVATVLGIEWSHDLIPDYVHDAARS